MVHVGSSLIKFQPTSSEVKGIVRLLCAYCACIVRVLCVYCACIVRKIQEKCKHISLDLLKKQMKKIAIHAYKTRMAIKIITVRRSTYC